jgi:tetratricopeptide (TPR) repeat protein
VLNWGRFNGLWAGIFAMMLTLIVHSPSRSFELLLYDDPVYVSENPQVISGLSFESLKWAFTTGHFGNWHPLTWLSLQWDVTMGGGSASAFHTTNLALHVATTGLLAFFFRRFTGCWFTAFFAATLYGIHPMHVESVVWVSERKGLLSTFFLALCLIAYLYFVDRPGLRLALLIHVFFAMSLMSKPMGVTLPLLVPLLHWVYPRGGDQRDSTSVWSEFTGTNSRSYRILYSGLGAVSVTFAIIAYLTQSAAGALAENTGTSLPARLATATTNYVRYIRFYFWPSGFSFTIPRNPDGESVLLVAIAVFAIAFGIYAACRLRFRCPFVAFGFMWYLIAFLPVIGVLQVGNQVMAMRYSDWPLIGIHLLVAHSMKLVHERLHGKAFYRFAFFLICTLAVLFLGLQSGTEARYWANDGSLYRRAIELSPRNALAHAMLGRHYMDEGKSELAVSHLNASLDIFPGNAAALSNLALLSYNRGNTELAWDLSRKAIAVSPEMREAQLLQGLLYADRGDYREAEEVLKSVLEACPNALLPSFNLASIYRRQERYQEALELYNRSLKINPSHWQSWYYAGQCLESLGKFEAASAAYGNAIAHSTGSSMLAIRSFIRIRLLCGSTSNLVPLLNRLQDVDGTDKSVAESLCYLLISGSKPSSDFVAGLVKKLEAESTNDVFDYELLGDAYAYLGESQASGKMYSAAESLWAGSARAAARTCRQSRIVLVQGNTQ